MKKKMTARKPSKKMGRRPLPEYARRQLITSRVAPETAKWLRYQPDKLGAIIDSLVAPHRISEQAKFEQITSDPACETMIMDGEDGLDMIMEQARGLLAMMAERGTRHLSEEHIEILSTNFELLINNYLATFKKKTPKPTLQLE
jgi:hypothetical protein